MPLSAYCRISNTFAAQIVLVEKRAVRQKASQDHSDYAHSFRPKKARIIVRK